MSKTAQKKENKILIMGVVLALVGILAIGCGVWAIISANKDGAKDTTTSQDKEKSTALDNEIQNFVALVSTQVVNYQTNNRGKLPADAAAWNTFWNNYVSQTSSAEGDFTLATPCQFNGSNCTKPASLTWEKDKLKIYIATYATCDTSNVGGIVYKDSARAVAVYSVLTTGKTYCASN